MTLVSRRPSPADAADTRGSNPRNIYARTGADWADEVRFSSVGCVGGFAKMYRFVCVVCYNEFELCVCGVKVVLGNFICFSI